MAKRFYKEKADAPRRMMASKEMYGGYENSKMTMEQDSKLIREDRSKRANLPTEVIERLFPAAYDSIPGAPDDLFNGVQRSLKQNSADFKKIFSPTK